MEHAEPPTRVGKTAGRYGESSVRETVVTHAPSDRSSSLGATAGGNSNGATVATLATALARVPTNQTRQPRARVETRA